jgi:hypothetical protein
MNADIRVENGRLVFGLEDCVSCMGTKTIVGRKACTLCRGTGRTKGGQGKGDCRKCNGFKTEIDRDTHLPCPSCNATGKVQSNSCSYVPDKLYQGMEFRVFRSDRPQSINEALCGMGYVYSLTDYGRHESETDATIIAEVRAHGGVQATKIALDDGTLAAYIGIFCNRNGYSVKAVWA